MTALTVIMGHILGDGSVERFSPEEDHLIETLGLDRSHETFRIRIHVRCLVRREQNLDAGTPDDRFEPRRENRISIDEEEALPCQKSLLTVRQISGILFHPRRRRVCHCARGRPSRRTWQGGAEDGWFQTSEECIRRLASGCGAARSSFRTVRDSFRTDGRWITSSILSPGCLILRVHRNRIIFHRGISLSRLR
jgi:hypothetical protein